MENRVNINLGDVQKTLFLPLWGRAEETKKKRPMMVDQTAARIIERVDYDFSQMTKNLDDLSQIAWIKRSLICDQVIRTFLESYPEGTIVNIGCGLDTTFDRIDNGKLKWYDLDLPDVIELRRKFIQESERRKFMASSFLDNEWLEGIEVKGKVLFFAAGVLYYFEENQVKDFIIRLADKFPNSEILFDVASPIGVRVANKKVVESSGLDERSHLKWGLENKKVIPTWDSRIKIIRSYYFFRNLRVGLRNILMGMLSDYLGIQYMLHLKLGAVTKG